MASDDTFFHQQNLVISVANMTIVALNILFLLIISRILITRRRALFLAIKGHGLFSTMW